MRYRFLPALVLLSASQLIGCKPLKVSSDKSKSLGACPAGSIDASGYCIRDGLIYLLHEARSSEVNTSNSTTTLNFGKFSFIKGDRVYAFGRFSFAKVGSGVLQTLGFKLGETSLGASSTQFVGDQDSGVMVSRNTVAQEISENADTTFSLRALPTQTGISGGSDGALLIFRPSQISEAVAAAKNGSGTGTYFVSDLIDSDKLLASEVKASETPTLISASTADSKSSDLTLIRSGFSWEAAVGKTAACDGVLVTWHLNVDGKKLISEGPYALTASRPIGSASMQALSRGGGGAKTQNVTLTATLDTGGRSERTSCVLKVGEPSTLSVVLFRSTSELLSEIQNARHLFRLGGVAAPAGRFASNSSGPPIETILQFSWDHIRSDVLMTDVAVTMGAEDRVNLTKAFLQLSRAPDSLSSHLGKITLKAPDRPRSIHIFDLAAERNLNDQTRFYVTGMGFNNDSKPVILDAAQIFYLHFRRLSDQL
jgi:hypothetical protein